MTAEPLPDDVLREIRRRSESNHAAGFTVDAHSHGEKGCRCLSCRVYTAAVVTVKDGFYCDEQPEAERASDGGCAESFLASVDAENLVKGVTDVRVLMAEIDRLKSPAGKNGTPANILRKLLSLAHH